MIEPANKGALAMGIREIIAEFAALSRAGCTWVEVELVLHSTGSFAGKIMAQRTPSALIGHVNEESQSRAEQCADHHVQCSVHHTVTRIHVAASGDRYERAGLVCNCCNECVHRMRSATDRSAAVTFGT